MGTIDKWYRTVQTGRGAHREINSTESHLSSSSNCSALSKQELACGTSCLIQQSEVLLLSVEVQDIVVDKVLPNGQPAGCLTASEIAHMNSQKTPTFSYR